MTKICFNELNGWLKAAVIMGWINLTMYIIIFIVAFIQELIKF